MMEFGRQAPAMRRRAVLGGGSGLGAAWCRPARVNAAAWPAQSTRLIIPYAPAGGTDTFIRRVTPAIAADLGQQWIVENRAGANGITGSEVVSRAAPDGYTLGVFVGSHLINRYLVPGLPFDPLRDFTPISLLYRTTLLLAAEPRPGFTDFAAALGYARRQPGSLSIGTSEAATTFAATALVRAMGVEATVVPYRGAGPMMNDLIGGHIALGFTSSQALMPHVGGGRLRPLAVSSTERAPLLPEVPTVRESGFPGYRYNGWAGLFGPPGLPDEISHAAQQAFRRAVSDPAMAEQFRQMDTVPLVTTPREFSAFLLSEDAMWARAAQEGLLAALRD